MNSKAETLHQNTPNQPTSRRRFFWSATKQAILTLGSGSIAELGLQPPLSAQTSWSPETALQELMSGNQRFVSNRLTHHEHDLDILKQHTVEKQQPFAALLSCADSRVPVELIFDQSIGHIFVTRIAGNIVTSEVIASLEYAAAALGTKVVLVLGHGGCGAVKATIELKQVPGQISALYPHIQQAVDQAGANLETAIKLNAKIQASLLSNSSTVLSALVKEKQLIVVAGYYDLARGTVTRLD